MVKVGRLLKGAKGSLFVTEEVFEFVMSFQTTDKDGNKPNRAMKKLKYFADGGFIVDTENIRFEGGGVYRIEIENTGRIIGFRDGANFIATKAFHKKKQKLTNIQRAIISKVKKIYASHDWITSI